MASSSLRLCGTLRTLSSLRRSFSASSAMSSPTLTVPIRHAVSSAPPSSQPPCLLVHSWAFRSSSISLLSSWSPPYLEGCDHNHWLILIDFPRDCKLTPKQMVETYEQTCAKGLKISLEEAKKKIYACNTARFRGFQAVMTEEESENFMDLPGVTMVLPDAYIYGKKEYPGDKYINGTVIRRRPMRRRDSNRNPDQLRYNRQGNQMSNTPGNPSYNNQRSMQGDGGNYGTSPPQQNHGPASHNYPEQQYGPASPRRAPVQHIVLSYLRKSRGHSGVNR